MKKIICGALMLTLTLTMVGCGKSEEKLTCTMTDDFSNAETTMVATFENDKVTGATITMEFDDKETAESYKTLMAAFSEEKFDAKVDGKKLIVKASNSQMKDEFGDETSMKNIKANLEDEGYTCK